MRKVLMIITTGFEPSGGLATVAMNYYRAMNKSGISIDFASTNELCEELRSELVANGSRYFNLGNRKKKTITYICALRNLLKSRQYNVVHIHGNSATMYLELKVAKDCGIRERIVHGHTTRTNYPFFHKILTKGFRKSYTKAIAVSKQTGDWLYGSDYIVLNNAIDVNHYSFNQKVRKKVRSELNIDERFVVGNVGKLNPPKNQKFLLQIFSEIRKTRKDAFLLIAGGGELESALKQQARNLHIENEVRFLGMLDDTSAVLQAMDVFVFTSLFEGLGMALIEAQASGLEVLSSDVVPRETKVSDLIYFKSLEDQPSVWAEKILTMGMKDRNSASERAIISITESGYNISKEADKLERIYRSIN